MSRVQFQPTVLPIPFKTIRADPTFLRRMKERLDSYPAETVVLLTVTDNGKKFQMNTSVRQIKVVDDLLEWTQSDAYNPYNCTWKAFTEAYDSKRVPIDILYYKIESANIANNMTRMRRLNEELKTSGFKLIEEEWSGGQSAFTDNGQLGEFGEIVRAFARKNNVSIAFQRCKDPGLGLMD
jgi:hypothetical protein